MADLYGLDRDNEVYVFDSETADDATAAASRKFNLTGVGSSARGLSIDGDDLYVARAFDIFVFANAKNTANNGTTAARTRQIRVATRTVTSTGLSVDGDDLYVADDGQDKIYVVPKTTSGVATTSRVFDMPSGVNNVSGLVVDGDFIYVADLSDDRIYVFSKTTAAGTRASLIRSFTLPITLTTPTGLTVEGDNLYCTDSTGDEVFVFSKTTANNTMASTIRRFDLPDGFGSPEGLSVDIISQASITISTTDTDIRAGESVNFNFVSDIDISGFIAADVTVTNGTRGALTRTDAKNYILAVTAGSAGTMKLAMAEDVVEPGNTAVSQDFTVKLANPSTPTSVSASAVDHDTIDITFTASTGTVSQYQYRRATSTGGLASATWVNGGTSSPITIDGLSASTLYYFQIRAINAAGSSAASSTVSATTTAMLVAPGTPGTLSVAVVDHDSLTLSFGASTGTVARYQYRQALSSAGISSATWNNATTATSITVDNLSPSTEYFFQVRATNSAGNSAGSNIASGTTQAAPQVSGTIYFMQTGGNAIAYDFNDSNVTTKNNAKDRNLRTLVGGSDVRSATLANTPNGRRIAVIDNGSPRAIRVMNEDFTRDASMDVTLRLSAGIYTGLCATPNGWVCSVWDAGTWRLEYYSYAGVEDTAARQAPTNRGNNGLFADDTYIYIVSNIDDAVYRRTFDAATITSFITLGTGGWNGGASTSDRFILVDSSGNRGVFYDHSGTLQSGEQINLPNASYDAVLAVELPPASATFTISTTDTLTENTAVTIDIVSDIDITGFTASDITVTGGTRGSLTGSGKNYELAVTLGSAGTLKIAIGADAVMPGNAAISQDFTITAAPVSSAIFTITTTDTDIREGDIVPISIVSDIDITGFTADDITVTGGTRGSLTGSGKTYALSVTAGTPGTLNIAIGKDAVSPGNAAISQDFTINAPDLTFVATTPTDNTVTATLTSNVGDLLSVTAADFTLRRSDTNAVVGTTDDISVTENGLSGGVYTWTITITNSTNYANNAYIQIRVNAFFRSVGFARLPSTVINSNVFKFIIPATPAPGTPGTLSASALDHNRIRLTFGASSGTVTQYQYRRSTTSAGLSSATWTNGGNGTSITVTGLTPNTTYYFQVRACNQSAYSAAGNTANAKTQAAPLVAPGTPGTLSTRVIDHDSVELSFGASSGTVTQYQYRFATSTSALASATWTDGGTTTTITLHSLMPTTTYYFQVRACNQTSYSAAGNTATATTQAEPPTAPTTPPSLVVTVVDHDTVRLTFGASTGTVTEYQYRFSTTSSGLATAMWRTAGTARSITVDGLSPSTMYYFQVRAGNSGEYSAATVAGTGTTPAPPPPGSELSIEEIDPQIIIVQTADYVLGVDIGGNPTQVDVGGAMEGFDHTWLAGAGRIDIRSPIVERLTAEAIWRVIISKGVDRLEGEIKYSVVPSGLIFHDLPLVNLYRDVPIYFEILLENIPAVVLPTSTLLGLKADLIETGVVVTGEIPLDSIFTTNKGDTVLTVPLEEQGIVLKKEYPYQIREGDPPPMNTPTFTPQGNYGEIVFDDVLHAFNYEYD